MNVYIGGTKDYSAMQGPCASGFHVPTINEWGGVKNIMDGLSLGAKYVEYLHMPLAGYRIYESSAVTNQKNFGYYWTASPYGNVDYLASYFEVYSSSGSTNYYLRSCGMSIRPFKNEFVKPGSGWTTIYGAGSAGIFWDTVNGLISITGDGTTGYTIADKNLGAGTVYNSGNSLYESNCGKYYQWGNNYGFSFTGTVTNSSTRVDASGYGPGNYYNSSTFIKTAYNADWSTVRNDNLWGYNTLGEMKNAYIGEVWTPGSNTLAYYPLTASSTVNDMSGNNRNLTKYGSCVFGTYQGVSCLYLPGSESSYLKYNGDSGTYYNFTMSFYYYCMDVGNWSNILYSNDNGVFVNPSNQPRFSGANNIPNTPTITNSWKHIVCVANGSVAKIYINGVAYSGDWQTSRSISTVVEVSGTGSGHSSKGYVSNIIIESKARTDAEVLNYYNNTKSNYGL